MIRFEFYRFVISISTFLPLHRYREGSYSQSINICISVYEVNLKMCGMEEHGIT